MLRSSVTSFFQFLRSTFQSVPPFARYYMNCNGQTVNRAPLSNILWRSFIKDNVPFANTAILAAANNVVHFLAAYFSFLPHQCQSWHLLAQICWILSTPCSHKYIVNVMVSVETLLGSCLNLQLRTIYAQCYNVESLPNTIMFWILKSPFLRNRFFSHLMCAISKCIFRFHGIHKWIPKWILPATAISK